MVKKKVNLPEFLSVEMGCQIKWYEPGVSAGTICPMPNHKDYKPSFRMKFAEDTSMWIFHCLGCGAKGTIVDFCMEYYGIDSSAEAVLFICNKFGLKHSDAISTDSLRDVKKRVNLQRKMNCCNIVTSRQCYYLLKKDLKILKQ